LDNEDFDILSLDEIFLLQAFRRLNNKDKELLLEHLKLRAEQISKNKR